MVVRLLAEWQVLSQRDVVLGLQAADEAEPGRATCVPSSVVTVTVGMVGWMVLPQGGLSTSAVATSMAKPRQAGLRVSRPVSRILSWVTISLGRPLPVGSSGVPGSSAGRVIGTCFTLHRTGFGEPPCHHGAGGLLPHPFTLTAGVSGEFVAGSGLLSVPLFRRLSPPGVSPASCPSVSGLSSDRFLVPARGHPACRRNCSPSLRGPDRGASAPRRRGA